MNTLRLAGKTALITGAGQGIGAAIASLFAAQGANVVIATRTEASGREVVERIVAGGGKAHLHVVDLARPELVQGAIDAAVGLYGGLDILVHNAASFVGTRIEDLDEEQLEQSLGVNLKGAFRLSKAAIPHLRRAGGGRLLFTSSVTGPRVVMPGSSYYASGKSGLNGFIRAAAMELAEYGITVNGVEPGFIKTPAMDLLADEAGQKEMARYIPLARLGEPDDIAYAMLYLASEEAKYVTGQTIVVDGGSTLPESPVFADGETEGVRSLDKLY